jgi:hypothetical protein
MHRTKSKLCIVYQADHSTMMIGIIHLLTWDKLLFWLFSLLVSLQVWQGASDPECICTNTATTGCWALEYDHESSIQIPPLTLSWLPSLSSFVQKQLSDMLYSHPASPSCYIMFFLLDYSWSSQNQFFLFINGHCLDCWEVRDKKDFCRGVFRAWLVWCQFHSLCFVASQ